MTEGVLIITWIIISVVVFVLGIMFGYDEDILVFLAPMWPLIIAAGIIAGMILAIFAIKEVFKQLHTYLTEEKEKEDDTDSC